VLLAEVSGDESIAIIDGDVAPMNEGGHSNLPLISMTELLLHGALTQAVERGYGRVRTLPPPDLASPTDLRQAATMSVGVKPCAAQPSGLISAGQA